ncbi:hypothetical protein JOD45_000448 [Scopulibacillus daqui]|uniref:Uncharacterized protein n=1 Tax=Scopulibacillus daqui TaxID=1469162 RepID=A0ABS2PW71_9BACL|nr:hypothetical protein [Scopulibacillus daqui]
MTNIISFIVPCTSLQFVRFIHHLFAYDKKEAHLSTLFG